MVATGEITNHPAALGSTCAHLFTSFFHFSCLSQNLISLSEDYPPEARPLCLCTRKSQVPRNLPTPTPTPTQQHLINDWWHGCINISAPSSLMGMNLRDDILSLQIYPAGLSHSYSPWDLTWYRELAFDSSPPFLSSVLPSPPFPSLFQIPTHLCVFPWIHFLVSHFQLNPHFGCMSERNLCQVKLIFDQ